MKLLQYIFLVGLLILATTSCEIDDLPNPNGSSINGFTDASRSELQTLITGTEDLLRQEIGFYYDVVSIVGREYWFFTGSDPRYTGELLGRENAELDNAGFYGTRPYFGRYQTIKNGNIIIDAVANSTQITNEEAQGYLGFVRTLQAYEYHIALNLQHDNGIRIDVADPNNLGPFLDRAPALAAIASLLDEAATNLQSAGGAFPFVVSDAMADFSDPASFLTFNRALAARIALYQGDNAGALANLAGSFIDTGGSLNLGPARFYSLAGGDFANNLFRTPNQADGIIAHPTFLSDMLPNDARMDKVQLRDAPLSLDDLTGDYDVVVYKTQEDFVPFIRNEELVLISAEANVGTDNGAAEAAINWIRSANGLGEYTGGTSDSELIDEILFQRRYSLFGEGHRWVDMRRFGRLDELPLDRPGDDVWVQMPRPVSE